MHSKHSLFAEWIMFFFKSPFSNLVHFHGLRRIVRALGTRLLPLNFASYDWRHDSIIFLDKKNKFHPKKLTRNLVHTQWPHGIPVWDPWYLSRTCPPPVLKHRALNQEKKTMKIGFFEVRKILEQENRKTIFFGRWGDLIIASGLGPEKPAGDPVGRMKRISNWKWDGPRYGGRGMPTEGI